MKVEFLDTETVERYLSVWIDNRPHNYKCRYCLYKSEMPTNFCPNCGSRMVDIHYEPNRRFKPRFDKFKFKMTEAG